MAEEPLVMMQQDTNRAHTRITALEDLIEGIFIMKWPDSEAINKVLLQWRQARSGSDADAILKTARAVRTTMANSSN